MPHGEWAIAQPIDPSAHASLAFCAKEKVVVGRGRAVERAMG